eukprot:6016990-Prorocentrum_lima.AAC.1
MLVWTALAMAPAARGTAQRTLWLSASWRGAPCASGAGKTSPTLRVGMPSFRPTSWPSPRDAQ